jgi:hypothetical protein
VFASAYVTLRLPKAEPWIDALVVEVSTRLFLQPKEEPKIAANQHSHD